MTHGGNPAWEMKPGTVLGAERFVLIEALGQGGMGVVWLAHDQRLDEDVALKLVPPEIRTDAGALEDLRQETLRSRKLSHPNIVRLHDLNEFPGEPPFISMEFVDGQTVAAFKAQQPQRLFTWEQVRPMIRQLCEALEYAHGEKVVHRDLKPMNMMLDRRGRLKLADFGLAAVVSELTSRVSLKASTSGTPAYMSPQQMDGRMPRVTDDIYALGATLYELLTSKPPFYHGDIPHQVRNLPPDSLEQRLAELELSNAVPPFVSALIMACLAKDPAQRPQSAAAVAEWLQLGGQSVTSALATEVTQRSNPGMLAPPALPSTATAVPMATPIPMAGPVQIEEVTEAAEEASPPKQPKWSWKKRIALFVGVWLLLGVLGKVLKPGEQTATLFNNRDFTGWTKLGPDVWRVEDGVIKATTQERQRSYLVWDGAATDFELTFGYKPRGGGHGIGHHGIFYRATIPERGGIPNGLAMPLDINDGWEKGELLVSENGQFQSQEGARLQRLRPDDWNQIRIRVEGSHILQAINGVTSYEADRPELLDGLGDQITFEIWNDQNGGERSVEIRNIVLRSLKAETAKTAAPVAASGPANANPAQPEPRPAAGSEGWDNIYAYTMGSTERFRGFKQADFPGGSWRVENGMLQSIPGGPPIDLMIKETFGDFEFEMEYAIGPESNSGIIYRSTEAAPQSYLTGPEMQLAGERGRGINAPDQRHGALFGLLATTGNPGRTPIDGYQLAKVRVQSGKVEHLLNEQVVLEYDWNDAELRQRAQARFKHAGFMQATEGYIVIQHRGADLQIRRMRVKRL